MNQVVLRPFTEEEYHTFFRRYEPDPRMDPTPYRYQEEQISRSYRYQYGGFQQNYAHYGIFLDQQPVGAFQLKRIDPEKLKCEFGIILQNESVRNRGIGTEAIRLGLLEAERFGLETVEGDTRSGNLRMQRVFDLLARPDFPIGAIADFSGFGCGYGLRKLFRARTGMSLREWRKTRR